MAFVTTHDLAGLGMGDPAPVVPVAPGAGTPVVTATGADAPVDVDPATLQQAAYYENDPRLRTVYAWAASPEKTAEAEANALLQSFEEIRNETVPLAQELQRVRQERDARLASIRRMRAEIDALTRRGMGELIDLENMSGIPQDPFMHGLMSSVRKAVSKAVEQVKDNVTRPTGEALKAVDKAVIRPWSQPLNAALKVVDRAIIRPWSSPLNTALKKFDKAAIRPVGKAAVKGMGILDKFVPGWTVLLDVVMPLPLGTILQAIAGKGVVSLAAGMVGIPGQSLIGGLAQFGDKVVADAFGSAASIASSPIGKAFPLTIAKGTDTFIKTKGPFLTKLRATATEALQGATLVLSLAATVVTAGAATPAIVAMQGAIAGLSLVVTSMQAGLTVLSAQEAAQAVKKQAREIRAGAQAELQKIAEEEAKYKAEIAKIKAQIAAIQAEKARVAAAKKRAAQDSMRITSPVITRVAKQVGVSNEVVIVAGGLAAIAGVMVVASLLKED